MNTPDHPRTSYRFGPFQVDLSAHELWKSGERVKVQELPFRILALLLEHPGQVVGREQLQKHLWPEGTFVEFEHGLNTAVKKLRQAIEDDAENPRFIETVPRKGYRFIGEVHLGNAIETPRKVRRWIVPPQAATIAAALAAVGLWAWFANRAEPGRREAFLLNLQRLTTDSGLTADPAISPDGQLVAYASDRAGGNLDIWLMHAQGGDPIRLTENPADDREPHFCPDGRIVFRSDRDGGGIYIVSALGGGAVLLAKEGRTPRCSPDGTGVAFWTGSERGYLGTSVFWVSTSGGVPTRAATDLRHAFRPVWSPDGRYLLVFGVERTTQMYFEADWWLSPIEGGRSVALRMKNWLHSRLEIQEGVPLFLDWDVRTGEVLFSAADRAADPFALWQAHLWAVRLSTTLNKPSGPLRQLTSGSGKHRDASSAANGSLVLADLDLNPDIWSVIVDHSTGSPSGALQPVLTDKAWQSRPAVSRDGTSLIFRTQRGHGWDFWRKDLKNGQEKPVTISGGAKVWAVITADGSKIAYHTTNAVHTADTQTGASRVLCEGCRMRVADWTSAADGVLAYNESTNGVELLALDGSRAEVLKHSSDDHFWTAKISPDGQWIAYYEDGIRVARFDGRKAMTSHAWKLARFEVNEMFDWAPDGNLIYFLSRHDGPLCLWAVRAFGNQPPFPVMHFHEPRRALLGGFAVAPDRLYLGLHETTGNIWVGRQRE